LRNRATDLCRHQISDEYNLILEVSTTNHGNRVAELDKDIEVIRDGIPNLESNYMVKNSLE
jgi:hypothetical protein